MPPRIHDNFEVLIFREMMFGRQPRGTHFALDEVVGLDHHERITILRGGEGPVGCLSSSQSASPSLPPLPFYFGYFELVSSMKVITVISLGRFTDFFGSLRQNCLLQVVLAHLEFSDNW